MEIDELTRQADTAYELWQIDGGDPQRIVSRWLDDAVASGSAIKIRAVLSYIREQTD